MCAASALAVMFCCCATVRAAVVFAPPDDSVDAANELKGIERELSDRNFANAARRVDTLLGGKPDALVNLSEGTLTSVSAWVDQLTSEQRKALRAESAKSVGPTAAQGLEGLRQSEAARPEEFYALARRYPLTEASGAALAEAGERALRLGDLSAAQGYYELALRAEFPLGEARLRRLEELKKINGGASVPAPADLADASRAGARTFAGLLPFDGAWFGNPAALGQAKFFPATYDDRIVLATHRGVFMLRESGQVVWTSGNSNPSGVYNAERGGTSGRGALFQPAALCDVHGRPVVIVVREPSGLGEKQWHLRAVSAADGKTIWTSDAAEGQKEYAGLPVVSGRFVYSVAMLRTGVSGAELQLCAHDVISGQALWQTPLGSVAEQGDQRFGGKFGRAQPLDMSSFAEISEPAVAGDLVIVSPNCGSVIAVGRFDGKIRWVAVYREGEIAGGRRLGARPLHWATESDAQRALVLRYKNTPVVCGDVVVAMPQDAPAVFAFDRSSGKRLWDNDLAAGEIFGLAGGAGNFAIVCGSNSVCAMDCTNGGRFRWRYTPRGAALSGPACVIGQTAMVQTSAGLIQLNIADGTEKAVYSAPSFRRLLGSESGRSAVAQAGAGRGFGAP